MPRFLYISCSQFSGSTLASFVLNTHPGITTVGHMTGWNYAEDEEFRCSCGEVLAECPFYRHIAEAFARRGLPFDMRNFGTGYRLSRSNRLNRALSGPLLRLQSNSVELARDALVRAVPPWRRTIDRTDAANLTFAEAALAWSGAEVFLDNSQDPHRARQLARAPGLELLHLHLVRDPRGTILSMMTHAGWGADLATRLWLRRQSDIVRVAGGLPASSTAYYESLCSEPNRELARVCSFAGLEQREFEGDFKTGEHHVLGNAMRFRGGNIKLDERWRRDMAQGDRATVERILDRFRTAHPRHGLAPIIAHYLDG